MISFEVKMRPQGKDRARSGKNGHYTTSKTKSAEAEIAWAYKDKVKTQVAGPFAIEIIAVFKPAKSWSKAKVAEHMGQPHTQKPDKDNIEKLVLDALNGVAYDDDASCYKGSLEKRWGIEDKLVIHIREFGE